MEKPMKGKESIPKFVKKTALEALRKTASEALSKSVKEEADTSAKELAEKTVDALKVKAAKAIADKVPSRVAFARWATPELLIVKALIRRHHRHEFHDFLRDALANFPHRSVAGICAMLVRGVNKKKWELPKKWLRPDGVLDTPTTNNPLCDASGARLWPPPSAGRKPRVRTIGRCSGSLERIRLSRVQGALASRRKGELTPKAFEDAVEGALAGFAP